MRIDKTGAGRVLTGLRVKEAMGRNIVAVSSEAGIDEAIRRIIKYKVDALVATEGAGGSPLSVVSKTDLMGAYYAGLPVETPLSEIVSAGGVICCTREDTLASALEAMKQHGIHRLYVKGANSRSMEGVISYTDMVGLLYRYCRACEKGRFGRGSGSLSDLIRVKEVMTSEVLSIQRGDTLYTAMELLATHGIGAVLVRGENAGIVSKTDLVLAFGHGVPPGTPAETVMTSPVHACAGEDFLHDAIRQMIFCDIHRLFVTGEDEGSIIGVLSLTDAARARSGSCHACTASRIII